MQAGQMQLFMETSKQPCSKGTKTRVAIDDPGRRVLEHLRTYNPQNVISLE